MKRPNILMIMADQFRSDWMGCAGADFISTPNIDRIAARGTRFTRAVCNGPICSPSRVSIASGLYTHRTGVLDNFANYPSDMPTFYQELRKNGYRVGVVGKTDLHKTDHFYGQNGDIPFMYHLGFTDLLDTEGKMSAAWTSFVDIKYVDTENIREEDLVGPYQRYLYKKGVLADFVRDYMIRGKNLPVWYSAVSALTSDDYHDGFIGRNACKFLEEVSCESPWYFFVSFVGPHDPWDAPEEYYKMYENKDFPASIHDSYINKPEWVKKISKKYSGGMKEEDNNKVKQHYAGMISLIDNWIGKMLDIIEKRGLSENTVVIFCADHGEMMGDHGMFTKGVMYESSVRVPLIISCPGLRENIKSDALAEMVDIYPTILELSGVPYGGRAMDGKSLVPILKGYTDNHKEYQVSELARTRMIFDGRYKYIENHNDLSELYDLEEDPYELNNIIENVPDLAKRLRVKLKKIRSDWPLTGFLP